MAAPKKEALKKIPGFSQGVRVNSAMRMVKLARPICPHSKIEMKRDTAGNYVPVDKGPNEQNCQMAGAHWVAACEALGHDPYFTTRTWTVAEPIIEADDQGRMVKTGEQLLFHSVRQPNLAQVALALRMNNGKGVDEALSIKDFKRLKDIGYEEVCQFRNCQKEVTPAGSSRSYGNYCSKEHLRLIAADAEGILLKYVNVNLQGTETNKVAKARERQLREVELSIT